jgi:hypothetical protein
VKLDQKQAAMVVRRMSCVVPDGREAYRAWVSMIGYENDPFACAIALNRLVEAKHPYVLRVIAELAVEELT